MAQRMVKKLCSSCKVEEKVTPEILEQLELTSDQAKGLKVYKAKGCSQCNDTGYSGRTGIFEVMPISPAIEKMIIQSKSSAEIRAQAIKDGMLTLRHAAIQKMAAGIISLEQVIAQSMSDD